ncbi:packaged DNA stabilization protein [Rhodovulum sp. PH10]|uniref:packaged DNA stabilization protein n=1 Tax=Rhodovulum sp. PH10 TaxID=1187851 RepID=UPI00058E60EB|nr:packaged DNA stabilization protein [Rhodovulum sp. PH10]
MAQIVFPTSSSPGARPQESGGRLVNCFAEPLSKTAPSDRVIRRVPGLAPWGTTVRTGFRGATEINGILYSAWDGHLVKHTAAGGAGTEVGTLNGDLPGFFARNNATTPDQVFVDPDGNIATFTSTGVTNGYPSANLPSASSVTSIDGYLVFGLGDGRAFATGLNTTNVDALSFAKAEARPDGIVRVITFGDLLLFMGNYTTEAWTDVGATPFPFQRSTVITRGLIGPYAVAGFEDQFSQGLFWVAENSCVYRLSGYQPEKISPPDLDRLIEAVEDKRSLRACAYMAGGHPMWELSCPAWTWVFDITTGFWHERARYLGTRSRIDQAFPAFGKWLAGDATGAGAVGKIDIGTRTDFGSPLPMRVESAPVGAFPQRVRVARADFHFAVGTGQAAGLDPIQTDPVVEISWTDDAGVRWSNPLRRSLGRQAEGDNEITVRNTGVASRYGRRWRLDISDPVYVGLMGGTMTADPRG